MKVQQISVFLENKSGRLATLTRTLANENINIRALSIADTTDFGILRLIVDKPDAAYLALKRSGFTVSETSVIAVAIPDHPGGLAGIMDVLAGAKINIEYLYALPEKTPDKALVIFRVERLDDAIQVLQSHGIGVLKGEEVYGL
ncbi:ACT domain-containing protein [Heliobacillus mobilis]|uniref:ACT domain-containing protein n=2 Tax=Heliobacterium TaxID=2697 RepID=A0A6I3SGH5_HELMO|nr:MULTISPECIES: ACT domain-containing protein [Heliobacterium]MBC9785966.1 ACT domain-containing protein [Heliobacterium chlorum]MTV47925.1 ACT domain-containing protein [Heliobacterium mobile]